MEFILSIGLMKLVAINEILLKHLLRLQKNGIVSVFRLGLQSSIVDFDKFLSLSIGMPCLL